MPRPDSSNSSGHRLFVGHIDPGTEDETLRLYFERFGELTDYVIMRYPDSMKSRCFGFVSFAERNDLDVCLSSGPHIIDDAKVEVKIAASKESTGSGGSRGYGGGGYRGGGGSDRKRFDRDLERRLFVGRLGYDTSDEQLRKYFGRYGELSDYVVMRWPDSMKSRGFGFVTFRNSDDMEKCLSEEPHTINGQTVELTRAKSKDGSSGGGGGDDEGGAVDLESKEMRRLFLGRLSYDSNEDAIREYFGEFGEVAEAVVMRYNDTGKSRGFGFVTFAEAAGVDACQAARPHTVDGKVIEVRRATSQGEAKNPEAHMEVKKLWVGGFNESMSDADIKAYFEQFNVRVTAVEQMCHNDTGKKRGFGFVEFDDTDAVDKICLIGRHSLNDKKLEVKKALNREQMAVVRASSNKYASKGGDFDSFMMEKDMRGMMMGGPGGMDMKHMFAMFMQHMMSGGGMDDMRGGGGGGRGYDMDGPRGSGGGMSMGMFERGSSGGSKMSGFSSRRSYGGGGGGSSSFSPSMSSSRYGSSSGYGGSSGRSSFGGGGYGGSMSGSSSFGRSGGPLRPSAGSYGSMRESSNPYSRPSSYSNSYRKW